MAKDFTEMDDLVSQINESFKGTSVRLGQGSSYKDMQVDLLSSGLCAFDTLTRGGIAVGFTEMFGWEGSGKTTFALHMIAQAQKQNSDTKVGYIDMEHALNVEYAKKLGVDLNQFVLSQPNCGEDAIDTMRLMIESGLIKFIVLDSIAAMVPLVEINGEVTDANMGAHAKLMSKMCRIIKPLLNRYSVRVIAINQLRHKIGVFFGSPEVPPGGNAMKFNAEMRIKISGKKDGEGISMTTFDIKKSRHSIPHLKCEERLILGEGFDIGYSRLAVLKQKGIVTVKGSNYYLDGNSLGAGKAKASEALASSQYNKLMRDVINGKI